MKMKKGKKFKGTNKQHRPEQAKAEVLPKLEFGFLNAAAVTPREWGSVQIVVAGAGGNGSQFVRHAARLMDALRRLGKAAHMTICDPDTVAEENIGRQDFCYAERGAPKAETLARRFGHAYGLNVSAYVGKYDESLLAGADLTVLVGCVDKAEGRRALHQTLRHNGASVDGLPGVWWLDLGNLRDTGRVLVGSAYGYESMRGAFPDKGRCVALPSPALQSPGLLKDAPEDLPGPDMSCAEMVAANLQGWNVNAVLAAHAAEFLTQLLITGDLKRMALEVYAKTGNTRPVFTTPEEAARVIGKPVSHVTGGRPGARAIFAASPDDGGDFVVPDEGTLAELVEALTETLAAGAGADL